MFVELAAIYYSDGVSVDIFGNVGLRREYPEGVFRIRGDENLVFPVHDVPTEEYFIAALFLGDYGALFARRYLRLGAAALKRAAFNADGKGFVLADDKRRVCRYHIFRRFIYRLVGIVYVPVLEVGGSCRYAYCLTLIYRHRGQFGARYDAAFNADGVSGDILCHERAGADYGNFAGSVYAARPSADLRRKVIRGRGTVTFNHL